MQNLAPCKIECLMTQKIKATLQGIKPCTSSVRRQCANQTNYRSLLCRSNPQPYLIRANRKKYILINHSLVC
jgi:hypothetical protein